MEVTEEDRVDWDRELVVQGALGTIEVSTGPRRYHVTYERSPGTFSPVRDRFIVKALHQQHAVSIVMRRVLDVEIVSCGRHKWSKENGWGTWYKYEAQREE